VGEFVNHNLSFLLLNCPLKSLLISKVIPGLSLRLSAVNLEFSLSIVIWPTVPSVQMLMSGILTSLKA
jgi:hypothetical protein